METGYYEAFNRDNVLLVDVRKAPILEITETGLRTSDAHYELDVVVPATGFDALTGSFLRLNITGRDGLALEHAWREGPRTYPGIASHGFPNLFMITGPQSASPLSDNVMSIEEHVDFAADAIGKVLDSGLATLKASREAEADWCELVDAIAAHTLIPKANSCLMGSNVPGKPRAPLAYLAGMPMYGQICADVVADDYKGFCRLSCQSASVPLDHGAAGYEELGPYRCLGGVPGLDREPRFCGCVPRSRFCRQI
jgi:hypothetical protein